jgi:ADP-ribose pyrophosphatase YjhB (NUDIX family)
MKVHSCGAILYTIFRGKVYIILGKEHGEWFPFKGRCENGESLEETAVREIEEETCQLIKINPNDIRLKCNYTTSRKTYHIGLIYVNYGFVKFFNIKRKELIDNYEYEKKFLEKTQVKMFSLDMLNLYNFHVVTSTPIEFYLSELKNIQNKVNSIEEKKKYTEDINYLIKC